MIETPSQGGEVRAAAFLRSRQKPKVDLLLNLWLSVRPAGRITANAAQRHRHQTNMQPPR